MTKHVFVTGGVVSSLGKGITAASLGRLLKSRGYKVTMQKADPYLNVDPGTMSPFQHGEVFVTEDGYESDLDLGHYERFIDENLTRDSNFTTGAIYKSLIARGQGIGRSIVAYAQKLAEGDGRSRLYLRIWARDLKAEGFAKKCRFRKAETVPMEVLPGTTLDITTWEKLWR